MKKLTPLGWSPSRFFPEKLTNFAGGKNSPPPEEKKTNRVEKKVKPKLGTMRAGI